MKASLLHLGLSSFETLAPQAPQDEESEPTVELAHNPEKCEAVFPIDHARTNS
jgi:hypothetical protein